MCLAVSAPLSAQEKEVEKSKDAKEKTVEKIKEKEAEKTKDLSKDKPSDALPKKPDLNGVIWFIWANKTSHAVNPNKPADITDILLSQTEVIAFCPANSDTCSESNQTIEISITAVDPENDVLVYH